VAPRVGFGNVARLDADDRDELDLPVDAVGGDVDRCAGPDDAGRELGEGQRHRRQVEARLLGVHRVVEAEREHLPWPGDRRGEGSGIVRLAMSVAEARGPGDERVPVLVHGLRVAREPPVARSRDVDRAAVMDERQAVPEIGDEHLAQVYAEG
jgi:hypothetical protein